jgi:mono/diheme cytochrome c family protein
MRPINLMASALLAGIVTLPIAAHAADGDWKRGRVYYRMVCTACHTTTPAGAIAPNARTKAEWAAYIQADKHAKGKDTVKFYVSKQYRDRIKATNKAAAKFADVPEADLLNDVRAFMLRGAKDGDEPAGCN